MLPSTLDEITEIQKVLELQSDPQEVTCDGVNHFDQYGQWIEACPENVSWTCDDSDDML